MFKFRRSCSVKKSFRKLAKIHRKNLCGDFLSKKRLQHMCSSANLVKYIKATKLFWNIFFHKTPCDCFCNLFLYYVNKLLVEIKYNVNSFLKEINKASFLKTKWHSTLKLKSQFQILDILQGVSSLGVSLIWQVVFKLGYVVFCLSFRFEWTGEKSQATIILGKFASKP